MAYPVTVSGTIAPLGSLSATFRPAAAGLVKVVVVGVGQAPSGGGSGSGQNRGNSPEASTGKPGVQLWLELTLEIFRPGQTTPAFSQSSTMALNAGEVILWGDVMAEASDLAADWTARVTNPGGLNKVGGQCDITVRYQVLSGNLGKIDHIVVLMQENRSFDHMLGYLKLTGANPAVDGLTGDEKNLDYNNNPHQVNHLTDAFFRVDPGHGWPDVDVQLWGGQESGFVKNFSDNLKNVGVQTKTVFDSTSVAEGDKHLIAFQPGGGSIAVNVQVIGRPSGLRSDTNQLGRVDLIAPGGTVIPGPVAPISANSIPFSYTPTPEQVASGSTWSCRITNLTDATLGLSTTLTFQLPPEPLDAIMGYYQAADLPAYDFLAKQFAICDRWFASLPTDTWPNRLYALTGGSGGLLTTPSDSSILPNPPGLALKTIFEVLQGAGCDWDIFFSDLPFALIFKALVQDASYTARMQSLPELANRARIGDLPQVSWLDPKFNDVESGVLQNQNTANDDHPPGNVTFGQNLVSTIYNLLQQSPSWTKTLFLITYDEHGGFFDHVRPPGTPGLLPGDPTLGLHESPDPAPDGPPDDNPALRRYGVRVPAFVISPWVNQGTVSNETFDHTSLIATILRRFCAAADGSVPNMGARANGANDVGSLLAADSPRATFQAPTVALPSNPPVVQTQPSSFGAVLHQMIFGF